MTIQPPANIEAVIKMDLGAVSIVSESSRELRFRVQDPIIYPAHEPFEIVFEDPTIFTGEREFSDVRLKRCKLTDGSDVDLICYEFVEDEIVPTEGRPFQVSVYDHKSKVIYGTTRQIVKARVIARSVTIRPSE